MEYYFRCQYCGHDWIEFIYSETVASHKTCTKCNDRHVFYKAKIRSKIDYYAGSPDFVVLESSKPSDYGSY